MPTLSPLLAAGEAVAAGYVLGSLICFGISLAIFMYVLRTFVSEQTRGQRSGPALDEILDDEPREEKAIFKGEKIPDWKIATRVKATRAVAKFIANTDNWFETRYLTDVAEEAVRVVKKSIERRTIQDVEDFVTSDCLDEIRREVKTLRKKHQRRIFSKIVFVDFQLVHVARPVGKENHTFTVLLTLKSRDYLEDEEEEVDLDERREEERLEQRKLYQYQEFWSFRRTPKRWCVELVQPSADVDSVLEAKSILPQIDYEEFAADADQEWLKHVVGR